MNTKIGLFFGSNTGSTELVAGMIQDKFEALSPIAVDLFDIGRTSPEMMLRYQNLIIGCPTWYIGQLQEDWEFALPELDALDLSGRRVAFFGLGDQYGYPDTFVDAIGILGRRFESAGADLVGFTSSEGYDLDHSDGVIDGVFMGLALDEDNQGELTSGRVTEWVNQLSEEFELRAEALAS